MLLRREFRFEAAHTTDTNAACQSLHGHSYRLRVGLEGQPDPATGYMVDFDQVEAIVREQVLDRLDHGYLNDTLAVPTSENIAVWVWRQLEGRLPGLAEVALWETVENCVVYRGEAVAEGVGAAAPAVAPASVPTATAPAQPAAAPAAPAAAAEAEPKEG